MTDIRHIVLSGGGHYGFAFLGMLEASYQQQIWQWPSIQSIHGTSVGALIGAILCLKYEWEVLIDYFIKRPWSQVYLLSPERFLQAYEKNGLFQRDFFVTLLEPLFQAKEIPLEITLEDYWKKTGIHWVGTTFEINTRSPVSLSYQSHPNLGLIDAIHRSCAVPILFSPVCTEEGECFMDGALHQNYPIPMGVNPLEILGIRTCPSDAKGGKITQESNLYESMMVLTQTLLLPSSMTKPRTDLGAEFIFYQTGWQDFIQDFQDCFSDQDKRRQYYLQGRAVVVGRKN